MQRDYTYTCLSQMPHDELEELSLRMVHRLVPEESMTELFTFESEETAN